MNPLLRSALYELETSLLTPGCCAILSPDEAAALLRHLRAGESSAPGGARPAALADERGRDAAGGVGPESQVVQDTLLQASEQSPEIKTGYYYQEAQRS